MKKRTIFLVLISFVFLPLLNCSKETTSDEGELACSGNEIYHPQTGQCLPRSHTSNPDTDAGESQNSDTNPGPTDDTATENSETSETETSRPDTVESETDDITEPDTASNTDAVETQTDTSECDQDGDGFESTECGGSDCNDKDPEINPSATEACGSVDRNCDGNPAEGLSCEFYVHTSRTLYKIDPFKETKEVVKQNLPNLFDIDTHPNGTLYWVSSERLYVFNPQMQRWDQKTDLITNGAMGANGLCINGGGEMFISVNQQILKVNPQSGQLNQIARTSTTSSSGDCVVNKQGAMLRSSDKIGAFNSSDTLVYIDERNSTSRVIGEIGYEDVYGLTAAWEEIYGVTANGEVIRIDPETAESELITRFPQMKWYGAASTPQR